jgi:hypothetical protein
LFSVLCLSVFIVVQVTDAGIGVSSIKKLTPLEFLPAPDHRGNIAYRTNYIIIEKTVR